MGKLFDEYSELAKHPDIADWIGKGHGMMDTITKNFEKEQENNDAKDWSCPQDEASK